MNNDMSVLRELQIVELKILKEVVRICEKHSLEYFAIDGTLLGAVRTVALSPGMTMWILGFLETLLKDL